MIDDGIERVAEALYGLLSALVRRTPRDLSLTAVATLSTLERTGPRRITDLAVVEGVAQPSMTSLADHLERDGLVERRSDPHDKRVALVAITAEGVEYLRGRRRLGTASLQSLLDKLPETEMAALNRATRALRHLRQFDDQERDPGRDGDTAGPASRFAQVRTPSPEEGEPFAVPDPLADPDHGLYTDLMPRFSGVLASRRRGATIDQQTLTRRGTT